MVGVMVSINSGRGYCLNKRCLGLWSQYIVVGVMASIRGVRCYSLNK